MKLNRKKRIMAKLAEDKLLPGQRRLRVLRRGGTTGVVTDSGTGREYFEPVAPDNPNKPRRLTRRRRNKPATTTDGIADNAYVLKYPWYDKRNKLVTDPITKKRTLPKHMRHRKDVDTPLDPISRATYAVKRDSLKSEDLPPLKMDKKTRSPYPFKIGKGRGAEQAFKEKSLTGDTSKTKVVKAPTESKPLAAK